MLKTEELKEQCLLDRGPGGRERRRYVVAETKGSSPYVSEPGIRRLRLLEGRIKRLYIDRLTRFCSEPLAGIRRSTLHSGEFAVISLALSPGSAAQGKDRTWGFCDHPVRHAGAESCRQGRCGKRAEDQPFRL
jgi:hypothetical protein